MVDRGVVHHDVAAPEVVAHCRCELEGALAVADVDGDGVCVAARVGDRDGDVLGRGLVDVRDRHRRTMTGQSLCVGLSDALAGAGDDGDAAGEIRRRHVRATSWNSPMISTSWRSRRSSSASTELRSGASGGTSSNAHESTSPASE